MANPERRAAALACLQVFLDTYFRYKFTWPWSKDHLEMIAEAEVIIRRGGQKMRAMPRGAAKTSLYERIALWAALSGLRRFAVFIGATVGHATDSLASIKTELSSNDLLLEDFPEVCYPVRRLEGITQRAHGQIHLGRPTRVRWRNQEIILPTIAGSAASGAILVTRGITGAIRGLKHDRPDGRSARPDLVLIDDPQTDRSAKSLTQTEDREKTIFGTILGLAGPGTQIAAIAAGTVIRKGDQADSMLDRRKNPAWRGVRCKMLYKFPAAMKPWEDYWELRAEELRNDGDGSQATAFYAARRSEMDAGAEVGWEERRKPGELSALQGAMNLYFEKPAIFASEYQNEPLVEENEAAKLNADDIAARLSGLKRGVVPLTASRVTSFVDVQQKCLFWTVCAWDDNFSGSVIDYGAYPDQGRSYFSLADAKKTMAMAHRGGGLEGSIFASLEAVGELLLAREWRRDVDHAPMKIGKQLIDCGWPASTATVKGWCRQTAHAAVVLPSLGTYVGVRSKPWSEYQKREGEQLGLHWRVPPAEGKRVGRRVLVDTNYWKTFVAERLLTPLGGRGALTLFGERGQSHRMFAEHCTAERCVRVSANDRTVDEWVDVPGRPDNHWWDGLVGCAVGASMLGAALATAGHDPPPPRKKVKQSERYAQKHGGAAKP